MKKQLLIQGILVAAIALGVSSGAQALTFELNDSSLNGSGPFGQVELTQVDGDTVQVTLTLEPFVIGFVDTGSPPAGNHPTIAWNLAGAPDGVTVDVIDGAGDGWNFYDVHAPASQVHMSDAFGKYMFALYCNGTPACGNGGSDANPGPVTFYVNLAGITPLSFVANAAGSIFVADILTANGSFLVRATDPGNPVPEPATMSLLGIGLLGGAARARRKKQ